MLSSIKTVEKIQQKQADAVKEQIALMVDSGQIPESVGALLAHTVACMTAPKPGETAFFVMIYPEQNLKVVRWLNAHSKRPKNATDVWALLLCNMKRHTGEITLTRDQIAEEIGAHPNNIGEVMREMVRFKAIFAKREKIPGLRGPGKVVYYMNKHIAQTGSRATKEELATIPEPGSTLEDETSKKP